MSRMTPEHDQDGTAMRPMSDGDAVSDPIRALRMCQKHYQQVIDVWGIEAGDGDRANLEAVNAALAAYRWVDAPDAPGWWWWCKRSGSEKQPVKVWKEVAPFTGKEHLFAFGTNVNALDDARWCPVLPPPREDEC